MNALTRLRQLPRVRRGWPRDDGWITFEQRDPEGRLRAGNITASGMVYLNEYATDPTLPDLAPPPAEVELVVHRLGRRAVLLGPECAVKLVRPGRAGTIAESSRTMGVLCEHAGLHAAAVVSATRSSIRFALLPGRTLHDLGDHGFDGWRAFVEAWPALTASQATLPRHGPDHEAAVLTRWSGLASAFGALPQLKAIGRAVERTARELADGDGPTVIAHRDLHDKQLMWDGAGLGVLDLDTAARAEAALDLANLWVHVELRRLQGVIGAETARDLFGLLDGMALRLPTTAARLTCYRQAARLRLACVYAFRPNALGWLPEWVDWALDTDTLEWS